MAFLTDFADQAVILPVAAAILLGLLAVGWLRGALAWAVCVAGVLAVMLGLKLLGLACGNVLGWGRLGIVSPSGHTAAACVVYGGLGALLMPRSRAGLLAAFVLACAVVVLVAATRLVLHVHAPGEVVVGAVVGLTGAAVLRWLAGPPPARAGQPWLLLAGCAAMLVFHGHRLQAEERLRWLALDMWPLSLCKAHDARPWPGALQNPLPTHGQRGG